MGWLPRDLLVDHRGDLELAVGQGERQTARRTRRAGHRSDPASGSPERP